MKIKKRVQLTEESVAKYKAPESGQDDYFDTIQPGLVLRVNYGGRKVWLVRHYLNRINDDGKRYSVPTTKRLGRYPLLKVKEARDRARAVLGNPQKALAQAETGSFQEVAEQFIKRYVMNPEKPLHSQREIERCLKKYVYPEWGTERFRDIKRDHVSELLDRIVEKHGPVQADRVLAIIRKLMNWHATRSSDYISPIVKGMNRSDPKKRQRGRVLGDGSKGTDNEIRGLWKAADGDGTFGALLKVLLLTAQRREKAVTMRWDDIADGIWSIPTEEGRKGTAGTLPLPKPVLEIIEAQARIAGNPYVFAAGHGKGPFNSFSERKAEIDKKLAFKQPWRIHDLRRTARTLMAKCDDILPDIAERVMGHKRQGVEPIYDRHDYTDQKAAALRSLAAKVGTIVNPPPRAKVAQLDEHRRKKRKRA
jgi:integrase